MSAAVTSYGERLLSICSGEVMQNLIHNRRVVVGVAVAVLLAVAIVLLVLYSGGGHSGGGIY
jgi:flagellar biosynthesis/type III secretory pathway M-ring protein FliF/YscJ